MAARATPAERAIDALGKLPVGDLAARDHVRTVRSTLAVANDDERLRFLRLLDRLDVDPPRIESGLERARNAAPIERLARSEAVHAVRGWFDLKDRLDEDRRVYAFFHPAIPGTPLVFTEVALTDDVPASIRSILNKDAPRVDVAAARSATFYSISNCEPGLTGIPFGNALIKHAVEALRAELPRLRTFATLSPVPGFAAWVRGLGERVAPEVRAALAIPGWQRNPSTSAALREPLLQLAARYLLAAKREDGAPRDAVARFHLANGALIERLDWLADPAPRGIEQSFGVMANYRYALARADPTTLEQPRTGISRRAALLAAVRGVTARAKRLMARAPART